MLFSVKNVGKGVKTVDSCIKKDAIKDSRKQKMFKFYKAEILNFHRNVLKNINQLIQIANSQLCN